MMRLHRSTEGGAARERRSRQTQGARRGEGGGQGDGTDPAANATERAGATPSKKSPESALPLLKFDPL